MHRRQMCGRKTSSESRDATKRPCAASMPVLRAAPPPRLSWRGSGCADRRTRRSDGVRIVAGAVIDHDDLEILVALGQHRVERGRQHIGAVVDRDHDGEERRSCPPSRQAIAGSASIRQARDPGRRVAFQEIRLHEIVRDEEDEEREQHRLEAECGAVVERQKRKPGARMIAATVEQRGRCRRW